MGPHGTASVTEAVLLVRWILAYANAALMSIIVDAERICWYWYFVLGQSVSALLIGSFRVRGLMSAGQVLQRWHFVFIAFVRVNCRTLVILFLAFGGYEVYRVWQFRR
jgi:hypothetical protein